MRNATGPLIRQYKVVDVPGLDGVGGVRINNAGCLGRCAEGPVLVVYPDEVWYSYQNRGDVDEIIESHLQNNTPVERLKI